MRKSFLSIVVIAITIMPVKAAECSNDQVRALVRDSLIESVVVGKVVSVGRPPMFWSGHVAAFQRVEYQVETVLKGKVQERMITVAYFIVHGSDLVNGEIPQLSPKLFADGNRQIVFLSANGQYKFKDEKGQPAKVYLGARVCSLVESDTLIEVIRNALAPE